MSVTITDPAAVERNTNFNRTITPDAGADTVTAITCTSVDSGVTVTTTATTIVLDGSYEEAFNDVIKSVPPLDVIDRTPTESAFFSAVPDGHIIFEANQDPAASVTKQYTAEVTIEDATTSVESTETVTFNHVVNTNTTTFANALTAIYPEDS